MKRIIVAILLTLPLILWATPYINEIYYDTPFTGDAGAFTEIKGDPGESLDNYYLVGINGNDGSEYARIDLSGYTIPADSYFVIADADTVANYDMVDTLVDWQNGPDNVVLIYDDGTTVDTVDAVGYGAFDDLSTFYGYGSPAFSPTTRSICRIDFTGNNMADWMGSEDETPGTANSVYAFDNECSIYDIQYVPDPSVNDSTPLFGETVNFDCVVTAISGNKAYVQDDVGEWHGLVLYGVNGFNVSVGDSLRIVGMPYEYYNVTEVTSLRWIYKIGEATVVPTIVTGDSVGENYEGQFIRICNAEVVDADLGYGEWLINDGYGDVRVDDEMYAVIPDSGHVYAYVQGPLNYSYGNYKIEPRDEYDVIDAITITGTVTLSNTPSDMSGTVVTLTSSDTTFTTTTNADGSYTIDVLSPHVYTITFVHDGYITETISDTLIDSAGTIDMTLTYLATLTGTVNLSDNPSDLSGTIVEITDGTNTYTDTTEADGTYSITGIITGSTYLLSYIHPGYETYSFDTLITDDMTMDVTLNVITYMVSGTVSLSDNPSDLSGTVVSLVNDDYSYSATTATDGSYSIAGVVPGTYEISFAHEGYDSLIDTIDVSADVEYNVTLNNTYAGDSYTFKIDEPYPNPFRDNTTISLTTPNSADISVKVYDISGKLIKTVAEETVNKGVHLFTWDRKDKKGIIVPSGVYFIKVNYNSSRYIYRVIVLQ